MNYYITTWPHAVLSHIFDSRHNIRNRDLVFASTVISLLVYIFYTDKLSSLSTIRLSRSRSSRFKSIHPPPKHPHSNSIPKLGSTSTPSPSQSQSRWTRKGTGTGTGTGTKRPPKKGNTTTTMTMTMTMTPTTRTKMERRRNKKRMNEMSCDLPVLNPFDTAVLKFNIPPFDVDCTRGQPPIFTTDFNSNLILTGDPQNYSLRNCCYRSFARKEGHKNKVLVSNTCHPIKSNVTKIRSEIEFIEVVCESTAIQNKTELLHPSNNKTKLSPSKYPKLAPSGKNSSVVVVDAFGFVRLKAGTEKRVKEFEKQEKLKGRKKKRRTANVVILGLDGTSHMNLMRVMPKSYAYLTQNLSAFGLWGYTKVADNTFPNTVPVLTGLFVKELERSCWKSQMDVFDECPFIWKNYSTAGFRTSFGEDEVNLGMFNYVKGGFRTTPTDYFISTLMSRQRRTMGWANTYYCSLCYGPRLGFQVLLEQLKGMAAVMKEDRRYFQFIWATSLFHDYLNNGKLGDDLLLETLRWFKTGGYLEDTVFILTSDHGIRWGGIRETLQGKLEERMPFLYFVLPEWFREQYPAAVSSLVGNKNKLTTPFDLHETLKDLLHLDNIKSDRIRERHLSLQNWTNPKFRTNSNSNSNSTPNSRPNATPNSNWTSNFPRGISLFLPIPLERTCADAEIADQWCVCRSMQSVPLENNTLVREAARSLVHHVNGMFIKFPQCEPLRLEQILSAQVFHLANNQTRDISASVRDSEDPRLAKQQVTFSVSIRVEPSNATFEATTTRQTNGQWVISGEISRTNLYGDQSRCVTAYNLKQFCYCR